MSAAPAAVKLLLATRSVHKAREVSRIVAAEGVGGCRILTLEEAGIGWSEVEDGLEPHDTFEENAASKARYFARLSGLATVSDDSGLEVDALEGAPGVRTKRFAPAGLYPGLSRDESNNRYLLERLGEAPPARRRARYVCVACLVVPRTGHTGFFRGEAAGVIRSEPRGEGGFGYDPIFQDPDSGRTYAELTPAEKDERSHRGMAFRALAAALRSGPGGVQP